MLKDKQRSEVSIAASERPRLVVAIDTEEEFDWAKPHDRHETRVTNVRAQSLAHRIFEKFAIVPTYFVDYPVASQPEGYRPLKELYDSGQCLIGTHLHAWVSPPHDEQVCRYNSFAGNLPPELEERKLAALTDEIARNFGACPTIYRAGRYGVGAHTAEILHRLGYKIDMSVVPNSDFSNEDGPDFRNCPAQPYWFGPGENLLEIPLSVGYVGALWRSGRSLSWVFSNHATRLHIPGVLARSGLLERIRLSPEGISVAEQIRLTKALVNRGHRIFSYNYHSPSLVPGHTPYVRTDADRDRFLADMESYFEFFRDEMSGIMATPDDILDLASADTDDGKTENL